MDKPIPEAVRAQAAAWFAEYDKHNHFPAMLAEDAYAAGSAAAQKQWQLDVGSPRTPEQIAATVAWVQSLADSDTTPQSTQQGGGEAAPPSAPVGVDAPLSVFSAGTWTYETGQVFSADDLDGAAFAVYRPHLAQQPAAVDDAMAQRIMSEFHANDPGDVWPPDEQGRLRRKALQDAINNALATQHQEPTT